MIKNEKQKVTWNDLQSASQSELKKTYKLTDRQLDQQVRYHMDGASVRERERHYNNFYRRK